MAAARTRRPHPPPPEAHEALRARPTRRPRHLHEAARRPMAL